jgi:hypothetical protein
VELSLLACQLIVPKLADKQRVINQVDNRIVKNNLNPTDDFALKRTKFYVKLQQLQMIATACSMWSDPDLVAILDHTNDRIYNQL